MQQYKGYLVVSDLDGTLINSNQKVSKQNMDAIAHFVEEGGLFAVATGRTELNVKPFIRGLDINCPCILYNGAGIYDLEKQQFIKCSYLDRAQLLGPMEKILAEHKTLCMQIFTPGKMFITSGPETVDPVVTAEGQSFELVSLQEAAGHEWVKVLLHCTNPVLLDIESFLGRTLAPGVVNSVFSTSTYLELLPFAVSKGSALLELLDIVKVERENSIAIGDYHNDMEMVAAAGLGVATANAHQALKDTADLITVSNDEHAIHTLIYREIPEYRRRLKESRRKRLYNSGMEGASLN